MWCGVSPSQAGHYLDGRNFNQAHMIDHKPVYALAQVTIRYWIEQFGFDKIKKVLAELVSQPDKSTTVITKNLESLEKTDLAVQKKLQAICKKP